MGIFLLPFFIFIFAYFFPYFWAMAISSVMSLNIKLKFQILLSAFLFVFVGFCAIYSFIININYILFLAGFVIGTPFWVFRFYSNKRTSRVRFYIGLVATLFIIWEMEVPQQIIFHALTKDKTMYDIEIVDKLFDGNTTEVRYGFSEEYRQCFKGLASCPILPSFKQLQNQFFTIRDGKKIIVANVYGPYYGSTDLMLYLDTFKDGGGITYEKSFYIDDKKVFQYLRNLKSDNQKSSQKGENNGNK